MVFLKKWIYLLLFSFGAASLFLVIFQQFELYKADRLPKMLLEIFILLFIYTLFVTYLGGLEFKYKIYFHVIAQSFFIILFLILRIFFSINNNGVIYTQAIIIPAVVVILFSLLYLIIMFVVLRNEVRQINEKIKQMRDK